MVAWIRRDLPTFEEMEQGCHKQLLEGSTQAKHLGNQHNLTAVILTRLLEISNKLSMLDSHSVLIWPCFTGEFCLLDIIGNTDPLPYHLFLTPQLIWSRCWWMKSIYTQSSNELFWLWMIQYDSSIEVLGNGRQGGMPCWFFNWLL